MTVTNLYAQPPPSGPLPSTVLDGTAATLTVASNIALVSSQGQSQFAVITVGTEAPLAQSGAAAVYNSFAQNVQKQLAAFQTRRLFAPGQFPEGATNYTNRPSITVIKNTPGANGQSTQQPIGSYSDWYLNSVQEQDVERTDIIETFGAPHLFTSGRFTRKMVFSGFVRTTAMNNNSDVVFDRTPQHVLLRNFYENFLRSTAQAKFDYFTRIVVDGDTYEGYCVSLQLPRDASMEMVMQFALTMIVIRRYNIHDNDAISALSVFQTAVVQQLSPSFASAELIDAYQFTMTLSPSTVTISLSVNLNSLGTLGVINLTTPSTGQIISVSGSGLGLFALTYTKGGAQVSGTASQTGTSALTLTCLNPLSVQASGPTSYGLTLTAQGQSVDLLINVTMSE